MKRIKIIGDTAVSMPDLVYIHPLLYMLKTYHDNFGLSKNDYKWLRYDQDLNLKKNVYNILDDIIKEKVDIICFSIYCWNNIFLNKIAKEIKNLNPDIIIIFGGPDVMARTENDWFVKNDYVDYVIYSDGEKAFSLLLDYLADYKKDIENIPNLIYQKNGEKIINKHEVLRDKQYWNISPWKHCENIFEEDIKNIIEKNKNISLLWERSRGCPYSCSFCDWSGGLHNKVTRRTYDFKIDVDLIYSICKKYNININLYFIDANIGMFEEDCEIFKYICSSDENKKYIYFDLSFINWSKNHKERVYKIWDILFENFNSLNSIKISQQDMHDFILKNADRPSIPWLSMKSYIISKKESFYVKNPIIELIIGLPGQTRDTWYNNLIECAEIGLFDVLAHHWIMLPYTPANDENYQKKFNIKYIKTFFLDQNLNTKSSRTTILNNLTKNNIFTSAKGKFIYSANMIIETNSYNFKDLIFFNLSTSFYNKLVYQYRKLLKNRYNLEIINDVINILLENKLNIEKLTEEHYKIFKEDMDKYNCILFSIANKNNLYFMYRDWFVFNPLNLESSINVTERQYSTVSQTQDCA